MASMAFESAGTFSTSVKDGAGLGAVWLIRSMPQTAGLLHTAILWPDGVGRPDSYVLLIEGDAHPARYLQNRGLDVDHSGRITRGEVIAAVAAKLKDGLLPANAA